MNWDYCQTCRAVHAAGRHQPKWDVHHPDNDGENFDEFTTVAAADAEEAVEKWAEDVDSDSADYSIVAGNAATVFVRPHGTEDPWQKWTVRGEAVPCYSARRFD